jgi:hypothetical protein
MLYIGDPSYTNNHYRPQLFNLHRKPSTLRPELAKLTLQHQIPAEIFPTEYRCTCYGISAAFGKFGSILVQITLSQTSEFTHHPKYIGWLLIGFSPMMFLGAIIAWAWLPELQTKLTAVQRDATEGRPKFVSKKLEDLAVGWRVALQNGEVVGLKGRFAKLFGIRKKTYTDILPAKRKPEGLTGVTS